MKLFSNCGSFGQCCTWCYGGGCISGIGDDDYSPINLEEAQRRLDCSCIRKEKELLINYIKTLQPNSIVGTICSKCERYCGKYDKDALLNDPDQHKTMLAVRTKRISTCYECEKEIVVGVDKEKEKEKLLTFVEEFITSIPKDDCKKCIWCKESNSFLLVLDATEYYCGKYLCYIKQYHQNNPTKRITPCYECKLRVDFII